MVYWERTDQERCASILLYALSMLFWSCFSQHPSRSATSRFPHTSTFTPFVERPYGNRDCQASKGFDKYVPDGDAGFCWLVEIYLARWDLGNTLMRISNANASAAARINWCSCLSRIIHRWDWVCVLFIWLRALISMWVGIPFTNNMDWSRQTLLVASNNFFVHNGLRQVTLDLQVGFVKLSSINKNRCH